MNNWSKFFDFNVFNKLKQIMSIMIFFLAKDQYHWSRKVLYLGKYYSLLSPNKTASKCTLNGINTI